MNPTNSVHSIQASINQAIISVYSDIAFLFKVYLNRSSSLICIHPDQLPDKLLGNLHANLDNRLLYEATRINYTANDLIYDYKKKPILLVQHTKAMEKQLANI